MKATVPTLRRCLGIARKHSDVDRQHREHVLSALKAEGIEVLSSYGNGRKTVLVIDRPPPFVHGGMRRRQPAGDGGREYVMAAPYRGLQLEWRIAEEARHG